MLRDIVFVFPFAHLRVGMLYVHSFVSSFPSYLDQGCHGQGKNLENDLFSQIREKVRKFVDGQGNLERTWEVREKLGNFIINVYGSVQKNYLFFSLGK